MSIDRQRLVEHLENNAEQLRLKIEGYEETNGIDSGMILMWISKNIMLTHLLDDIYRGKFDEQKEQNPCAGEDPTISLNCSYIEEGSAMRIDDYIGLVAVIELDTMVIHEGMIENAEGSHIKVVNGTEIWVIPRHEVVKITPIQPVRFREE